MILIVRRSDTPDEVVNEWMVVCKGCKKYPIPGIRWKCMECANYDLCGACHSSGAHLPDHKMLKVENPEDATDLDDKVRDALVLTSVRR